MPKIKKYVELPDQAYLSSLPKDLINSRYNSSVNALTRAIKTKQNRNAVNAERSILAYLQAKFR